MSGPGPAQSDARPVPELRFSERLPPAVLSAGMERDVGEHAAEGEFPQAVGDLDGVDARS